MKNKYCSSRFFLYRKCHKHNRNGGIELKIIHCADLHLDSKMETNLTTEQAKERRNELLATFEHMVEIAVEEKVDVILIVGDMFDTAQSSQKRLKARVLDIIKRNHQVDFLYLQGNHDKDNYFKSLNEKPNNLKMFHNQWSRYTYGNIAISGVELYGGNEKRIYSELILNENMINIVMLHGQVVNYGVPTNAEDIMVSMLKNKYVDYLALGHIHAYQIEKLDYRGEYCYSGCLEGRGYDECGEKGFVLLEVLDGKVHHEFRPICKRTIHDVKIDITDMFDHNEILERIQEGISEIPSKDYVKVTVVGKIDEDVDIDTRYIEQKIQGRFYTSKFEDKTEIQIDYMKYERDISLKGEFIRNVKELELTEQEKSKVIRMGIHALKGEEVI